MTLTDCCPTAGGYSTDLRGMSINQNTEGSKVISLGSVFS